MNEIQKAEDSARRHNAQEWAQRLKTFEASGQKAKDVARRSW